MVQGAGLSLDASYDPSDRVAAFAKALEFGDRIPLGVIYRNERRPLEERFPVIRDSLSSTGLSIRHSSVEY